jgi:ubiquinol-cytochrome c reductase iron-sulfur subunit
MSEALAKAKNRRQQADLADCVRLCAGAVGGAAAVPFVSSFQPSERAKAAGAAVEVDIAGSSPVKR